MGKTYAFAVLCALFCLNFTTDLTERRPLRAYVSQMQIPHLNPELGVSGLPAQAVNTDPCFYRHTKMSAYGTLGVFFTPTLRRERSHFSCDVKLAEKRPRICHIHVFRV